MKRWIALFGLACAAVASAEPPGYPQPLPSPLPLFPADNWWNADVRSAPVDPHSLAYLEEIGLDRGMHPDFGGDAGDPSENEIYGMPYAVVPGTQPLQPVTFVEYGDESDVGAPGRPPGYPIPDLARSEPRWIEGGAPGHRDVDGDRHLLIVDQDHRLLFELYRARWSTQRGRWEAGSGAVWPLDENRRRPEGWTSADAAGLAILPGLVRYDEAFASEPIRHAFRVTVRRTDGHVFPASHTAGDTSGALPMGARLRLKQNVDLSRFSAPLRRIFEAMKTYGLIVADNGSDLYVQGTYDRRWDNDLLNPAFASLTAGDFEVIQLGWRPSSPPTGKPSAPADLVATASTRRRVELTWRDRSTNETSFEVELRLGDRPGDPFRRVATVAADTTRAAIVGLQPGSRYVFRIRARNAAGVSAFSNRAIATTPR